MLLTERMVCVGVGQCGSNMIKELENLGFQAFYINSSLEDLDTINTNIKNKYHIKNTKGMAKDQRMAKQIVLENNNADNIAYAIHDQYAMAEIITFFYSLAGGTGGGMGTILASNVSDLFPNKIVNVVAVLPKSTEDIGLQANAIESLQSLKEALDSGFINQVHLLNNDSRDDIFAINKDFAICFDRFINFDVINKEGNLDEEEKEKMLLEPGMGVILEFSNDDFGNGLASAFENSIYAEWLKNPNLHGLILNKKQNKDVNKEVIKDVLGMPNYTHQSTWDEDSNVLFAAGMSFNENILNKMKIKAKELSEKKRKIEEEAQKEKVETVEFDTSAITSASNRRRKSTVQPTQDNNDTGIRRRRGERRASSVLDKYRNM
ncbi:hypothetical protein [Clostridium botulinum]|uniref:hypothetical protein n=1 Tax=Clostridium botulinum TaxID=1491 RepID=UPI000773EC7C|nr:hypothetical protein [Clostridium botulinum]QDY27221.1 hypothetical protein CGQ40_21185 [Clostridium botulinum]